MGEVARRPLNINELLAKAMPRIAAVCTRHLSAERLARFAVSAASRDPKLMDAVREAPETFLRAVFVAARLGLELDGGPIGGMHLVARRNKRAGRMEVGFIIDYRGLVDLAGRSGYVIPGGISAEAVYNFDEFDYGFGSTEFVKHRPSMEKDRGEIVAFYAVARLTNGTVKHQVMSRYEVEAIRDRFANGSDQSPWATDFARMGCKTVIRRLCNLLPKSPEHSALALAQIAEESGDNAGLIAMDAALALEIPEDVTATDSPAADIDAKARAKTVDEIKAEAGAKIEAKAP